MQCATGAGQPKEGKKQIAKELPNSARRLYHSNDYVNQEKAVLHAFQSAVGEELMCMEPGCKTQKITVDTVEIQEIYTRKAVQAAKGEENETTCCLKILRKKLEAIFGEL